MVPEVVAVPLAVTVIQAGTVAVSRVKGCEPLATVMEAVGAGLGSVLVLIT